MFLHFSIIIRCREALLLKLWRMTGFKKIEPSLPLVERLKQLQTIMQQISIERAHSMEVRISCCLITSLSLSVSFGWADNVTLSVSFERVEERGGGGGDPSAC